MELRIPARTILKIFGSALIVYMAIKLWPLVMLVFLAVLLAVTLSPVVRYFEHHRLPRWAGILIVAAFMVGSIAFFAIIMMPPLATQIGTFAENIPKIKEGLLSHLPQGAMATPGKEILNQSDVSKELPKHMMTVGGLALDGLSQFVLVLILSLYLVADGKSTLQWLFAFFRVETRKKLHQTGREVSEVIFAYVAGQVITSVLVFFYAFAVLKLLHVPAALVLAILAGIFDILPILGFFLSTIPAMMLALSVSVGTAGAVLGLYIAYHALENYVIVPKIYGNRLRLSTLTVLLALLAGGILGGVIGAIAVLPVVASYPIIERIWLKNLLGDGVVEKHIAQDIAKDLEEGKTPAA